jgi:hypothetical protein
VVISAGPVAPPARRRSDLAVAGALARRPFGVHSARAVARAAGVSPTTAARALHSLHRDGVVIRRVDDVAAGHVRRVSVWTIDWCSSAWRAIAPDVRRLRAAEQATADPGATAAGTTAAAAVDGAGRRPQRRVPGRLAHLFWNADLAGVDPRTHGSYVASRILRADDCQALGWLARTLHPDAIRAAAAGRGLDPRRVALAHLLAGA